MEQLRTAPLSVYPRDPATGRLIEAAPDWALFLDVDGTLLHIAETPGGADVNDHQRDGMNFVAKEYVAVQSPGNPGILAVSGFAGAVPELNGALIVSPSITEGIADALQTAHTMYKRESRERRETMYRRLGQFDMTAWRETHIPALAGTSRAA